jgi:hypothetical protein
MEFQALLCVEHISQIMDTPKNNNCQIYKIKDCNKRKMFLK